MIKDLFKCEPEGRMSADERRTQILQVAISLFSQHGFKGTTTKEIAKAAGVSEAIIFRHFSTKDELYGAILGNKACHDEMKFPWEENSVLMDAMQRKDDYAFFYNMALNSLNKQQADVGFMRLLFYSALEEHALAERFFDEFVSRVYEFVSGYIAERQKDGVFREVNPRIVVRSFMGMLIHHSLNNTLWDKRRRLLNISNEEAAASFAEILLKGISK